MKTIVPILIAGWLCAANALAQNQAVPQPSTLNSQPSSPNRVLELDGNDSYVELPPNIFTNLTEATVEGWVKWESLSDYGPHEDSHFFEFGKMPSLGLVTVKAPTGLSFSFSASDSEKNAEVNGVPRINQWHHIAAVSGPGGMKLFLDGVLVGTNAFTGSFAATKNNSKNFLGACTYREGNNIHGVFHGQMDEVRVWKGARTAEQIKANMFTTLTGKEPALASLWNFNDGTASDATTNGYHGTLKGHARVVQALRPDTLQMITPSFIYGTVTDETGKPPGYASIWLAQDGQEIAETLADRQTGQYSFALYSSATPYDLEASSGDRGDWKLGIQVQPGVRQEVNWVLKNSVSISGTVFSLDTNQPLNAVIVQALREVVQSSETRDGARTSPSAAVSNAAQPGDIPAASAKASAAGEDARARAPESASG